MQNAVLNNTVQCEWAGVYKNKTQNNIMIISSPSNKFCKWCRSERQLESLPSHRAACPFFPGSGILPHLPRPVRVSLKIAVVISITIFNDVNVNPQISIWKSNLHSLQQSQKAVSQRRVHTNMFTWPKTSYSVPRQTFFKKRLRVSTTAI